MEQTTLHWGEWRGTFSTGRLGWGSETVREKKEKFSSGSSLRAQLSHCLLASGNNWQQISVLFVFTSSRSALSKIELAAENFPRGNFLKVFEVRVIKGPGLRLDFSILALDPHGHSTNGSAEFSGTLPTGDLQVSAALPQQAKYEALMMFGGGDGSIVAAL